LVTFADASQLVRILGPPAGRYTEQILPF